MTAGSGIIHSEMPEQDEGKMWGFQFWINLPAEQKMRTPRYQEIASSDIPEIKLGNGRVRVLAGDVSSDQETINGAAKDIVTQPLLLDVQLHGGKWQTQLPKDHTALVYVYKGELTIVGSQLQQQQLAVLSEGDELTLAAGEKPLGALVLAAMPLNESIARSGPFVMNTDAELQQAFSDYRSGNFV